MKVIFLKDRNCENVKFESKIMKSLQTISDPIDKNDYSRNYQS